MEKRKAMGWIVFRFLYLVTGDWEGLVARP